MKTIMLVDDSPTLRMSLDGFLKKAQFQTLVAESGEHALDLLQTGVTPHLIITDLRMSPMDGIELIREARKIPAIRFIPILMLTTESQAARRSEAKAAGASGWLVKPVDGPSLLTLLGQLLPQDAA